MANRQRRNYVTKEVRKKVREARRAYKNGVKIFPRHFNVDRPKYSGDPESKIAIYDLGPVTLSEA